MTKTILLVDDEVQLLSLLSDVLEKAGFEVCTSRNGEEAIFQARRSKPDLILLDVMMATMDGFEFLRQHRAEADTPIIMLTAKITEVDKLLGLQLGADDYITKPFSPKEVVARVQAVLRRASQDTTRVAILQVRDVYLDQQTRQVTVGSIPIDLTRTEFDLLNMMMTTPNRVFSRMELLENIQGTVIEGYERTIDVHIKNLRSKLEPDPSAPKYIETVHGVGYRFKKEPSDE